MDPGLFPCKVSHERGSFTESSLAARARRAYKVFYDGLKLKFKAYQSICQRRLIR